MVCFCMGIPQIQLSNSSFNPLHLWSNRKFMVTSKPHCIPILSPLHLIIRVKSPYISTYLHIYISIALAIAISISISISIIYNLYLYLYIHTYLHTYILTYLHTYILTYVHTYIHTHIYRYIIYYYLLLLLPHYYHYCYSLIIIIIIIIIVIIVYHLLWLLCLWWFLYPNPKICRLFPIKSKFHGFNPIANVKSIQETKYPQSRNIPINISQHSYLLNDFEFLHVDGYLIPKMTRMSNWDIKLSSASWTLGWAGWQQEKPLYIRGKENLPVRTRSLREQTLTDITQGVIKAG